MARKKNKVIHDIIVGFLFVLFKITLNVFLRIRYNVKIEDNEAKKLKGGYFILANHTHNMDPMFIYCFWKRPIYYVINDTVWKVKLLRPILNYVELIPIRKNTSDSVAVRGIFSAIKQDRIVGIFPEGERSWGGQTKLGVATTASLIKKLKVPLVTVKISGAMMSKPRWAYSARRGKVVLTPKIALDAGQIADMNTHEISEVIRKELYNDEHEFLKNNTDIVFKSNKFAECLELYLSVCKDCGDLTGMTSKGCDFYCKSCGARYEFLNDCSLKGNDGSIITLTEWEEKQNEILHEKIKMTTDDTAIFEDCDVEFYEYIRNKPLNLIDTGKLILKKDALVFEAEKEYKFEKAKIVGMNIQKNNQFEFTYENKTYRYLFKHGVSAYKWQAAVSIDI